MIKIAHNVIDVVKYSDTKVIFAEQNISGKTKFFILDFDTGEKEPVTTNVYKLKKFGYAYEKICDKITDYINCDSVILADKSVLVMFEGGETGLFNREGEMLWTKKWEYNGSPVTSPTYDGEFIWCACKSEDCVVRYSADNFNIDIRIGGKDKGTFNSPVFASADSEYIYVCCSDRVRKISKENLTVSDAEGIFDIVKKFYKLGRFSIICKTDGTFIDKDE